MNKNSVGILSKGTKENGVTVYTLDVPPQKENGCSHRFSMHKPGETVMFNLVRMGNSGALVDGQEIFYSAVNSRLFAIRYLEKERITICSGHIDEGKKTVKLESQRSYFSRTHLTRNTRGQVTDTLQTLRIMLCRFGRGIGISGVIPFPRVEKMFVMPPKGQGAR